MKNIPWTIEERLSCRAVVDSARNEILHVDKEPSGSVTSRGFTAEELTDRIRLLAAAPKLVATLQQVHANAAESPQWIRRVIQLALDIALPQFRIGDQVQNIEDKWQGEVVGFEWINGDEMLVCQYRHQDGSLAEDDKRWFAPADMRLVQRP
jgi:hypothetical protein